MDWIWIWLDFDYIWIIFWWNRSYKKLRIIIRLFQTAHSSITIESVVTIKYEFGRNSDWFWNYFGQDLDWNIFWSYRSHETYIYIESMRVLNYLFTDVKRLLTVHLPYRQWFFLILIETFWKSFFSHLFSPISLPLLRTASQVKTYPTKTHLKQEEKRCSRGQVYVCCWTINYVYAS